MRRRRVFISKRSDMDCEARLVRAMPPLPPYDGFMAVLTFDQGADSLVLSLGPKPPVLSTG